LGHSQNGAVNLEEGTVHLAGSVFENAEFDNLLRECCCVFGSVAFFNAQQYEDPTSD
jgi:hypothetical protein